MQVATDPTESPSHCAYDSSVSDCTPVAIPCLAVNGNRKEEAGWRAENVTPRVALFHLRQTQETAMGRLQSEADVYGTGVCELQISETRVWAPLTRGAYLLWYYL